MIYQSLDGIIKDCFDEKGIYARIKSEVTGFFATVSKLRQLGVFPYPGVVPVRKKIIGVYRQKPELFIGSGKEKDLAELAAKEILGARNYKFKQPIVFDRPGLAKIIPRRSKVYVPYKQESNKFFKWTALATFFSFLAFLTGCGGGGSGNSSTIDYNIRVFDSNGKPAQGAKISFYSADIFNPNTGEGNFSALQPKISPDAETGLDGLVRGKVVEGIHHIVVTCPDHETGYLFNRNPWGVVDLDHGKDGPFNASGHIKYQENYPSDDAHGRAFYCVGDKIKFFMFGVNNSDQDETISFCVQDHTLIGGPSAPIVYWGNFGDPDETLTVPADEKTHRVFEFEIPSCWKGNNGRYDIHVYWPGDEDGIWHKIGNFFLINDTTPPGMTGETNKITFTDQSVDIGYVTQDPAQSGTVRIAYVDIASVGSTDIVFVDTDILVDSDLDGDPANDEDRTWNSSPGILPAYGEDLVAPIGENSGYKTVRIWKKDSSENVGYLDVAVRVDITKNEADAIADEVYNNFGLDTPAVFFKTDYTVTTGATKTSFDVLCNRYNASEDIGHIYNKQGGLTDDHAAQLIEVINKLNGPEYIDPILRCIASEFRTKLTNYLQYLKDNGQIL